MSDFRLEIYRDTRRQWRWRVIAANGKTVADSAEAYVNRSHALEMTRKLFPTLEYEAESEDAE